jgi:hypothetical protein
MTTTYMNGSFVLLVLQTVSSASSGFFFFFFFFFFFLFFAYIHKVRVDFSMERCLVRGVDAFFCNSHSRLVPKDYPQSPPKMKFTTGIYHPNGALFFPFYSLCSSRFHLAVYEDGTVCISILHPPGDDEFGYEKASERWNPIHTVER